jgi:dienelactone hydrolase
MGPNYTHSAGVPCGLPGDCANSADWGPSAVNVLRGLKAWELMAGLGYVDTSRIMAFGHSRGAFVTTALAAEAPARFRAAAHTAGGVLPDNFPGIMPRDSMVRKIRSPYLSHHGEIDSTVPLAAGRRLDSILAEEGVIHRLDIYPGYDHGDIPADPVMFQRTREWFDTHGGNVSIRFHSRRVFRHKSGMGIYDLRGRWMGNSRAIGTNTWHNR